MQHRLDPSAAPVDALNVSQPTPHQPHGQDPSDLIPDSPSDAAARIAAATHGAAAGASEDISLRFGALTHELRGLVDGSIRYLALAQSGLEGHDPNSEQATALHRQIDAARQGLQRMENLLQRAMRPQTSITTICDDADEPLVEALLHAADSMRIIADDRSIRLNVECSPRLVLTPAGPVYTILVNAIRNSIEAVGINGTIDIIAELATKDHRNPTICIDVFDDGPGPRRGAEQFFFNFGYSTRVHGDGVGLALIQDLVATLDGTVTLTRRLPDRPTWSPDRPGAHLCIRIPSPIAA